MYWDLIPVPSGGHFYKNKQEYFKVYSMTTEDELMLCNPNLFNKGDSLNILLEKNVCQHNDIKLDDLLLVDKEFLLLYLKETAYGNIVKNDEVGDELSFDTHNIQISTIKILPEENGFYYFKFNDYVLKINLIRVKDEAIYKKLSNLNKYIYQIISVNDIEDRNYINKFMRSQSITEGRKIKDFIDKINFGVNKKTFCLIKGKKKDVIVDIDESLFGLSADILSKLSKNINKWIFFLINEGDGYSWEEVLRMPVHVRKFQEEQLIIKLNKLKESMKQKR